MFTKKQDFNSHAIAVAKVLSESKGQLIFLPSTSELLPTTGVSLWSGLITDFTDHGVYRTVNYLTHDGSGYSVNTSLTREALHQLLK